MCLWCFVVFCGCFVDVLRVFCGVLRVVCSIFAKHTKHPKKLETHWKTKKTHNTLVYCGSFPRAKKFDCIAQNTFQSQNICKIPQNTAKHRKTVTTRFMKLRRPKNCKTQAKRSKTSENAHNIATIRIARIFGVSPKNTLASVAKAYNTEYTRKLRRGGHVPAGGHVAGLFFFFENSVLRCFAVFCGVLRCFMRVFLAFFTKQHKTDQKVYKTNNKYALCNTAQYGAVHLSLTQKMSTKKIRKTRPKHCKTSAKHRKTLF